jgi:energy-coupling factor transporter ATP-binding protein EcfA2
MTEIEDRSTQVVGVTWNIFLDWFREVWKPGQHIALIGPTGEGKSTFAVGILQHRKWVLALDPKGEDDTLSSSGFERITRLPLKRRTRQEVAEGKPARLIAGGSSKTTAERLSLKKLMHEAVEMVRGQGGWTIYADEFQILADRRMFGLDKAIEELLISARSNGTSVVAAFQAAAWVPKAATRQATYVVMWPTRDDNMIKAVAQAMGRPWRVLEAAVKELPPFHVLVIPKKISAPMVLTHPPKIN